MELDLDPLPVPGPGRSRSHEASDVAGKRSKSRSKRKSARQSSGRRETKEINGHAQSQGDVFSMSEDYHDMSPKKRKRAAAGHASGREIPSEGSSSWVEMEDDEEEEPEFIAESEST